jgi:large subunit ribosomal protein L23
MSLLSLSKRIFKRDRAAKPVKKKARKTTSKVAADSQKSAQPARTPAEKRRQKKEPASVMAGRIQLHALMSERSIRLQEMNTVVFRVHPTATKLQIAQAIREQYSASVLSVRTATFRPKTRRRGATAGQTSTWKKAYVTVDDIQKIATGP